MRMGCVGGSAGVGKKQWSSTAGDGRDGMVDGT